jgi:cytochrome c
MKKLFILLLSIAIFSCKQEEKKETLYPEQSGEVNEGADAGLSPAQAMGKEIFEGKGNCFSCHKPDQKVIGPSMAEIAKIYKDKNGDMVQFLKGKAEPIVDPSQYEVMKTNFAITKTFSDEELKAIEDYFYTMLPK